MDWGASQEEPSTAAMPGDWQVQQGTGDTKKRRGAPRMKRAGAGQGPRPRR